MPGSATKRSSVIGWPLLALLVALGGSACGFGAAADAELAVSSPGGDIMAELLYDEVEGTVSYRVSSRGEEIISWSPVGIETDRGDFRSGMELLGSSTEVVDETYQLPQGKVSTYHNSANDLVVRFGRDGEEMHLRFRAYDDGVAFRFEMPGEGDVEIHGESSAIVLAGADFQYWGQEHPNSYGYESMLGPIDRDRMSNPVLAHLEGPDHFVLMGQAATYGTYVESNFTRSGSTFRYSFPLDQEQLGPVRTELPFASPWRMVIVSPETPKRIVESYMVENLNPPTDPSLLDADGSVRDWVRPGRVMWDFIAGDRDEPLMWIDATAEMGWEYYLADAGFADRFGGEDAVREATAYAAERGVGVIGWAHTRDYDTYEKAASNMRQFAEWDLKGAKIDFFDHNTLSDDPRGWRDYEDTQASLQMRDWIFELGIENEFLLELHGSTIPTGQRRRYPHLMTSEGVAGMEKSEPYVPNDLTIPFIRNVMGPVSYTIIRLEKSPGSHAYQMAMSVVYEAGMMIYAEHGETLLEWPGREMIQDVPSTWDDTRFIDGLPGSHVIMARRKGDEWFVGGMTHSARTANVALDFLAPGEDYDLLLFQDDTHTTMQRETRTVDSGGSLAVDMLENGGFTARLSPAASSAGQ